MNGWSLTTAHPDYLQRTGWAPRGWSGSRFTAAAPERRYEFRVLGIGREDKEPTAVPAETWRLVTDDLMPGLHGQRVPLAMSIRGGQSGLQLRLGTWSSRANAGTELVARRGGVLEGILAALYPEVELVRDATPTSTWPAAGLVVGMPSANHAQPGDLSVPLDRIVRAMKDCSWSVLVLAHPVGEANIAAMRDSVVNEVRSLQQTTAAADAPSPLAEAYQKLLESTLKSLGEATATGAWRTGVYLMGDSRSYPLLSGLWRSIYSGQASTPEPIRVWDQPELATLAAAWAMPDTAGEVGPGHYHRPFEFQSLLTSHQLATIVHLPDLETPGYAVNRVTRFDAVPTRRADSAQGLVEIGVVASNGVAGRSPYTATIPSLTRHTFVAGVTGSGKTNTIFHLLRQIAGNNLPFLVIEPSKTEYRSLLNTAGVGERLHIFTVGDERVSSLRLNPFEFAPGTPVSVHLDLLRSLFTASFGMWNPLPQVLEKSLHQIYEQRGWDISTSGNARFQTGGEANPMAYPTLSDLHDDIEASIAALGYSDEITSNMRAALSTRIGALLIGGKGRLLDTPTSTPDHILFEQPVVLELEPMGDDDDKAFVTGLVLIRLAELARTRGQSAHLRHVIVVEEAHRLLANVPATALEDSNPRGKAVEAFVNLLAEVRAYGQAIIVADQTPVRLAPELIKSTNLKIAHRLVAEDDRTALGATMAMTEAQVKGLATIRTGRAAVFSEGDDAPLLIEVPLLKDGTGPWPDATRVAEQMHRLLPTLSDPSATAWTRHASGQCDEPARACRLAQRIAADTDFRLTFARMVQSLLEDPSSPTRLWADIRGCVTEQTTPGTDEPATIRCLLARATMWLAQHRGRQRSWSYADTDRFGQAIYDVLALHHASGDTAPAYASLQTVVRQVFYRGTDPYAACGQICAEVSDLCLYRTAAGDIANLDDEVDRWTVAAEGISAGSAGGATDLWLVAAEAGERIIEYPEEDWSDSAADHAARAGTRASLCYAQQMLHRTMRDRPSAARSAMIGILATSTDATGAG